MNNLLSASLTWTVNWIRDFLLILYSGKVKNLGSHAFVVKIYLLHASDKVYIAELQSQTLKQCKSEVRSKNVYLRCFHKFVSSIIDITFYSEADNHNFFKSNLQAKIFFINFLLIAKRLMPSQSFAFGPCSWLFRIKFKVNTSCNDGCR